MLSALLSGLLPGLLSGAALAQPTAFVGATLHPVSGPVIADGVLIVDEGRILAVGPRSSTPIPQGALLVELAGQHVVPGLVDSHSHIGGGRMNEGLSPLLPGISAIDAIDPTHLSLDRARAGGITTVNIMPGSGKLMGGQTAYLKLRDGAVIDDLLLCHPVTGPQPKAGAGTPPPPPRRAQVCGGMKMANGTNPQGKGGDPRSAMGAAMLQRQALMRGQERLRALQPEDGAKSKGRKKNKDKAKKPGPDLEADALVQVLTGDRRVHFHSHRADDIVTALRLQEEFGFELVLHHVSEAWKVLDLLGERQAMLSLILLDSPGGKPEALEIRNENGALAEAAGALVAFHTDDPITDSRLFLRMGALAVRAGMDPDAALRALTLNPARMMELEGRIGSLEVGKDADLVVLSGPPLSTWTTVQQTWVEGRKVFDRDDAADHRIAVGGDEMPGAGALEVME